MDACIWTVLSTTTTLRQSHVVFAVIQPHYDVCTGWVGFVKLLWLLSHYSQCRYTCLPYLSSSQMTDSGTRNTAQEGCCMAQKLCCDLSHTVEQGIRRMFFCRWIVNALCTGTHGSMAMQCRLTVQRTIGQERALHSPAGRAAPKHETNQFFSEALGEDSVK